MLTWAEVPNPNGGAADPTRDQVPAAVKFKGGEGIWYDEGVVYFTSKGDGRVWTYTVATSTLAILYDPNAVGPDAPLSGVDNITVSPSGDIFVCEDGADHDICMITPEFEVTRFLKLDPVMHAGPPNRTRWPTTRPSGSSSAPTASGCTSAPSAASAPPSSRPASSTRSRAPSGRPCRTRRRHC